MATIASIIEDYSPAAGQTSVPTKDPIVIQFDRLMDELSIKNALFVEGPDSSAIFGPDSRANIYPNLSGGSLITDDDVDFLESPGYEGLLKGTFSFDHTGDKTEVTFTPSQTLAASTEYTVWMTAAYSKSVADGTADGGNSGDGTVTFSGTYTGASSDTIWVEVTSAGAGGEAKFTWYMASTPLAVSGTILSTRQAIILGNGVYIRFNEGDFEVGDKFSAALTPAVEYTGEATFSFTTGSGSITALSSSSSTSVLTTLGLTSASLSSSTALQVVKTIPSDLEAQIDKDLNQIIIEFNKELDDSSISVDDILITTRVATGHPGAGAVALGTIAKTVTVSGRRIIISI